MDKSNKNVTYDILKLILYIGSLIVVSLLFFGNADKRLTIVETKLEQKVDGEKLQIQLKKWKDEIIKEVKELKK